MPLPASILERVAAFSRNLDSYLAPDYKETQLHREFIDPFFEALPQGEATPQSEAEAAHFYFVKEGPPNQE